MAALYKVTEKADWDPIYRYQNLLELQFRHEIAVPLNIKISDERNGAAYDSEDPRKYDVFEMDQGAFDSIIESVCDTLGQEDQLSQVLNELKTA